MKDTRDLLIEIGTEELPPGALKQLATAFAEEIHAGLDRQGLSHKDYRWYATPRRLAVIVDKLITAQADHEVVRRGPALSAAYDKEGVPTKAAKGFAGSCGVDISSLETLETDKGSWLVFRNMEKGQASADVLPGIIQTALSRLPIPKRMRWADRDVEFVRPVHWTIVMLGRDIVPCRLLDTQAGNESHGHRFHHPKPVRITSPATYLKKLKNKAFIIADFEERRALIKNLVAEAGEKLGGAARIEEDLLDEVTALVEWPVVITGSFDQKFLELPREVLIATMQDHQKYFAVTDKSGQGLLNYFITIANIESLSVDEIRNGNEKVIRPRLADAAFFWQRDSSQSLQYFSKYLEDVVFQKQLGTLAEKTGRVIALSAYIADQLGEDKNLATRAAELSKCDLFTEMVGEFPELQGIMGRYYAHNSGESEQVALALDEQYMPRFAGDTLPANNTGRILAIADKLDTLLGIFAIGQAPTGEKDPFALRRAAMGCLRIMIECKLDLDLENCLKTAAASFPEKIQAGTVVNEVFDFMMERLRRYYLDEGVRADVFDAVLARRPVKPFDFHKRIQAVTEFTKLPEAESLAAANKRIHNILRQAANGDPDKIIPAIDISLSDEQAEINLAQQLGEITTRVQPLIASGDYTRTLKELSQLRHTVDTYFDKVMVMVEDEKLRTSRLQLLAQIRSQFQSIADISRLQE